MSRSLYRICRQLVIVMLLCCPVMAVAQQDLHEKFVLLSVDKHDEVDMSRFSLVFSDLPPYKIKTSGQRLEIVLKNTVASAKLVLPKEDERLVQILVGQARNKLVLSFLLRRPPHFVNGVYNEDSNRVHIDVHWQPDQRRIRPAIARSLPGQLTLGDKAGMIRREISSKYRGNWLQFFSDYERAVKLQVPVEYSVAPFPCLALFEDVVNFLPLEVLTLARKGEWKDAMAAMRHVGLESAEGTDRIRAMLIMSDLQQRDGNLRQAQRQLAQVDDMLEKLDGIGTPLAGCAMLQHLYSAQEQTPYVLLAKLDETTPTGPPPARHYFDLFQAEVAIECGDLLRSKIILEDDLSAGVGEVEPLFRLRLTDIAYQRGDTVGAAEQYAALEQTICAEGKVLFPSSLGNYAMCLYRAQRYSDAVAKLKLLLTAPLDADVRDMTNYIMALALIHNGDVDAGYNLLHQITPGSKAARLAQGKIADLSIQSDDIYSRRRALQDYADLGEEMVARGARAEMQFKHALALHVLGRDMAAIDELETFLKTDYMSELRPHAQALLAELLPPAIHKLVEQGNHFQALVLVEQNHDLLVSTHREFNFLLELGRIFSSMEYYDSALHLYHYMLDSSVPGDQQEQVFGPLTDLLYRKGEYGQVVAYAEKYARKYPRGRYGAHIFFMKMQALLAQNRDDLVLKQLQQVDRPRSTNIDRLAAKLAWRRNMLAMARKNIDSVVGKDFKIALPADQLLQAEIMLRQGEDAAALLRYTNLEDIDAFADQARYRAAEILLRAGKRQMGLKLLQQLVDKGKQGQWRVLARETLAIARLQR